MRPKHLLMACCLMFIGAFPVQADENPASPLVKAGRDTIYYLANDGKRYLFPSRQTFNSWYSDFSEVRKISDEELMAMPIGGSITYRPGVKMVKATTSPQVYAVDEGGVLRWIKSESVAAEIYGPHWNKKIDDLPDTFFANYKLGKAIDNANDYQPAAVALRNASIDKGRGAADEKKNNDAAVQTEETAPATSEIQEQPVTGHSTGTIPPPAAAPTGAATTDTTTVTPPTDTTTTTTTNGGSHMQTISEVAIAQMTSHSATIVWRTNTTGTSFVDYGLTPGSYPKTAGTDKQRTKDHSVMIDGLDPATTYHYRVRSSHGSSDEVMTADATFTTPTP